MTLTDARMLVVDDETALREMFAKWLRSLGCRDVRTAANGQEALDSIGQARIDVLVTDVQMPDVDGVQLVRRLAALGHQVPCIIFVSAFREVDQREMYDLGVEVFLAKPFRLDELACAIQSAIADRPTLWRTPMVNAPRQSIRLEFGAAGCEPGSSPPFAMAPAEFRLGRGGFSARTLEPVSLGKIAFRCCFSSDWPELQGQGYVRWRSKHDHSVGIEFAYLETPGREWVADRLAAERPRCFIPAM